MASWLDELEKKARNKPYDFLLAGPTDAATVLRMVELLREADARLRNHNGAPHEVCPYCDFAREFHDKLEAES